MLGNWGGQSIWWPRSILIMKTEWKKLRKNNVENVDAGECLNYTGEKMLLAILAWDIGKAGQRRMRKKLGTWIGITGFYIRRRRRRITRNIVRGKLNVKCVSVEWGNLIGQDIWWVGSICWGVGVEKLMVMWGVEEDDTKGRARLPSTLRLSAVVNVSHRKAGQIYGLGSLKIIPIVSNGTLPCTDPTDAWTCWKSDSIFCLRLLRQFWEHCTLGGGWKLVVLYLVLFSQLHVVHWNIWVNYIDVMWRHRIS